jgi:CDP-6-deoxy-D-xylo-4-hexulose-3-dehydrase
MTYRVPYAGPVWGEPEIQAVLDVLRSPSRQLAAGPKVAEFERRIAALFGQPHGVMVNSGSSANLLALAALNLPRGSRVVTPALTFATTVAPILQLGLVPEFVDVEPGAYVAGPPTLYSGAAVLPLLLGNAPDMVEWRENTTSLIVDSCDTLDVRALTYADMVTTSFYASHVVTAMGGGGMVCCRWPRHAERVRLLANWGRRSTLVPSDAIEDRYTTDVLGPYDAKFLFPVAGYNMQATEAQAAFGLAQLDRLPDFLATRHWHFTQLRSFFECYGEWFVLPESAPGANWLAFPLTVRPEAPFTRLDFVRHLEARGIQTRPIMAGNILRQPGFTHLGDPDRFPVADSVMRGGVLLGCHQGLTDEQIGYVQDVADAFLTRYARAAA